MVRGQNGGYFWGLLNLQIFLGVLEIPPPDIFLVKGKCCAQAEPTFEEKMRVPPPPPPHSWEIEMAGGLNFWA